MNDFTKEELEYLLALACVMDIPGHPAKNHIVKNKIQSMIDKYCEHSQASEAEIFVDACKTCDALLLRNKTLREYNE